MAIVNDEKKWLNARNEWVHPDLIRADEKLKDQLVECILRKVEEHNKILKALKDDINNDIESYLDILLEKYNINAKDNAKKGNFTFEDYAKTLKVQVQMSEKINFNEKLNIAKAKIDEYLNDIVKDSSEDIKVLINKAFEVDKKGNLDSKKILSLRSYDIKDARWQEAMEIISESVEIVGIKPYIRFYKRDKATDSWANVSLDFANI
ncbi:DUF3164 family protein [Campylobacter sp. RM12640]|uniref:DUF3164 family protein n=1 Tax=unclassified Campylobacter TaxID=2593542 RepID=UPI003014DEAC|nr:DUF3164 family protein [Campylobacter sp. RM12640]MBZ7989946.1 DUF3164 family protein [Campylobacter sp. RM12635]